jgi:tRNA-Thr(GGU) m(6)t(6)A37 methyltransferase TsaA
MNIITFKPIGIIYSPFKEAKGTPIQPSQSGGAEGRVELFKEYLSGLADLDGFSHIILLYHFHFSHGFDLKVAPFLDNQRHGLFATRAPRRPNPIGLSVVRLHRIEKNIIYVKDIDIIDKTPLLDIKPYVHQFDGRDDAKIGWLEDKLEDVWNRCADERFDDS